MKILVYFDFSEDQIAAFRSVARDNGGHEVLVAASEEEAIAQAADIEALLGHFPPALCQAAPALRWIQSFSAGMDTYLAPEIVARQELTITNAAALYAPQGAEHAWALLLALSRGLHGTLRRQDQRLWGGGGPAIVLAGGTLGIIGMGGFGIETARRAAGYDMTVIATDPVLKEAPPGVDELRDATAANLRDLLRRSDAVILACPLTPETHHLIGREELSAMKETAFLVNVTRGGIVDEEALVEALEEGGIAGAGLDVCEPEPPPADSPLWDTPNLILTGHRAGTSQHRTRVQVEFFCQQLERFLTGQDLLNVVDKERGF